LRWASVTDDIDKVEEFIGFFLAVSGYCNSYLNGDQVLVPVVAMDLSEFIFQDDLCIRVYGIFLFDYFGIIIMSPCNPRNKNEDQGENGDDFKDCFNGYGDSVLSFKY
jgi:hypothetical protein